MKCVFQLQALPMPALTTIDSTTHLFSGPWAGLPVAWSNADRFDETTYRGDVKRCCDAGIPGVYTGGTTGEFYAMELDEFHEIARATVEECHAHHKPAMIGCSSTYTLGAIRRACIAAELGADAIQVTLPFWMEVADSEIVPFFKAVAEAAGELPLSIYETTRCKRTLTLEQHHAIKQAVPCYQMVKANAGTLGATAAGCKALSKLVRVFVGETRWAELGRCGARGGCSSLVYWNPQLTLGMWSHVEHGNWAAVDAVHEKIVPLFQFLHQQFGPQGFTDTAFDRLGGIALCILQTSLKSRQPYPSITTTDIETLRNWCRTHLPEMVNWTAIVVKNR